MVEALKPGVGREHLTLPQQDRFPGGGEGLASARIPTQEGRTKDREGQRRHRGTRVRRQDLPVYTAQVFEDTDFRNSNNGAGLSSSWVIEGSRS